MQVIRNPKTLALALGAILAGGFAVPAFAQDAGTGASGKHWSVVGGYAHQEPTGDGTIAGSKAEFDGSGATTLGLSYYLNDHVAIEGWGAATKFDHRVSTADGKIGTVSSQPYALSAQYHFRDGDATVRPFVGLGYFQNNIDDEDQDNLGPYADNHIGMTTPKGPMATVGMDLNFTPHLFGRVDARYMHGGSDIAVDGAKVGDADLNPVVLGVGVGARF
ncbi:MAG TPA: OmpW family outer membrane protein [Luteimonas sp.]|jgi:outer membrane protein|nr:OmpW family outer membrane protein [Luteimonas sp.]